MPYPAELPLVSIIIVNLNGRALLPACFDALHAQSYPAEKTEIILVDNGSQDDSVTWARQNNPHTIIIEAGTNLGFAGGNNLGAETAQGEFLAFINNDAIADAEWLRTAINAFAHHPDVACVASKMLNADGSAIDFVETGLNLFGRAFQVNEHLPAQLDDHIQTAETFAASGGAMIIRRDVFLQLGEFDADYIAYYEDVDLGWRLWLAGYKTLFVPESVVYHKKHQTGVAFANDQRYALSELNALRTLVKNLDDDNLWRVFSFSLLAAVKRVLNQAAIDIGQYRFGAKKPPVETEGETIPRVAVAILAAIDKLADELPHLMEKRRQVQALRQRSDAEIFTQFPTHFYNPIFPWRDFQVSQQIMLSEMDIPAELQPQRGNTLLIITHEKIGGKMAGPGIRAWEMAQALSSTLDVILATPYPSTRHGNFRIAQYHPENNFSDLAPLIDAADVILAMGPVINQIARLQFLGKPLIADLYDPFELEKLARLNNENVDEAQQLTSDIAGIQAIETQNLAGDFFICANERQRDFWLGTMLASGRVNAVTYAQDATLHRLIDVVPFGIPVEPPKSKAVLKGIHPHIAKEDKLLLWNGGLWQWFDPLLLIDALAEIVKRHANVKLYFAAGGHFDPKIVPEMPITRETIAHAEKLGLLNTHVFFGDWIPYDERGAYLLEADAVASIHHPGIETHFSSRTRIYDCIWAGVPVITTGGDPMSDIVEQHNLGKVVPPGDVSALVEAIETILFTPESRKHIKQRASQLCPQLFWTEAVKPIVQFVHQARFAPDALTATRRAVRLRQLKQQLAQLTGERNYLRSHLRAIEQGRVMTLLRSIDQLLGRNKS